MSGRRPGLGSAPPAGASAAARDESAHYDRLALWGAAPDDANRERLRRSHALVPADVRTVLDLGCGDGASSDALVARGVTVVGLDPSPRALRHARALPVAAVGARLPFPDRSFDLVQALEVIEHLPPPILHESLAEMARVARGTILVSTPHREALTRGLARCDRCGARFHRNLHQRSFTRADHAGLFEGLGFACERSVGVLAWRPSEAWARLRLALGGRHALAPAARCPRCGAVGGPRPRPPAPRRAALRLVNGLAWRATRPVPRWIVSRYRRREGAAARAGARHDASPGPRP